MDAFRRFCFYSAQALGNPWVFIANVFLVLLWLISGPSFGFSDTWQLVVNTATTVITYLAVFVIQNSLNRDSQASQLKLDELIRSVGSARNRLVGLQDFSDEELQELEEQFKRIKKRSGRRSPVRRGSEKTTKA